MLDRIADFVNNIDWAGYHVSVFEVLLVVFALIKKFNMLSVLILTIVLGKGFIMVQKNTDFAGPFVDTIPFIVFTVCSLTFLIYAIVKLFTHDD